MNTRTLGEIQAEHREETWVLRKYKEPKTLKKLIQLDFELQEKYDSSLDDYMGFYISFNDDEDRYHCTPNDAVIFGRTGTDGDHFAFSTNNWTVEDLEECPILFIQPMDDRKMKLVAQNIRDFIALFVQLKEVYVLERFDIYQNEADFINDYKEYEDGIEERREELEFICSKLREAIDFVEIGNVFSYITKIRKEFSK
ncbi:hypothetical protein PaeBR_15800 [Paenibacillus sp. BR2-3]|uniref:hypothetical protein n=1 Tax=Paenibacillus sp. BR2-3 TaxID=3048494 RepID=UPI0039777D3A